MVAEPSKHRSHLMFIMRSLSFILILFLAISFKAQRVITLNSKQHTFKASIDSSDDPVNHDCRISVILVYEKGDNKPRQTITPPDNVFSCAVSDKQLLLLNDINFDGYTDLMLVQLIPAAPDIPYYYWKYNKKSHLFERDTSLEDITSPDFDPDQQTITSFWRSSAVDHGVSTYKYIDGQITLVEETESDQHPDSADVQIFTRKKLVNGKLILVERSEGKMDDVKEKMH